MSKVGILGVYIHTFNFSQSLKKIASFLSDGKKHQIVTTNPEYIVLARKDETFKDILNKASLSVADGVGLVFAARLLNGIELGRIPGIDLMLALVDLAAHSGYRIYILGGKPENVSSDTARILRKKYPNLKIDHAPGSLDIKRETASERETIIKKINNFKPDFLFVAYGAPVQDKWIYENLPFLDVKVAVGVGGAFNYICGRKNRAPGFLRLFGFEWLWRLISEPQYRAVRVFNAVVIFPFLVIKEKMKIMMLRKTT